MDILVTLEKHDVQLTKKSMFITVPSCICDVLCFPVRMNNSHMIHCSLLVILQIGFQRADNIVSGLLAFIGAV